MYFRLSPMVAVLCVVALPAVAQTAKPTDPQIAHIAYTAGVLDIEASKQALAISKNADVRAFAEQMMRDHAAVNDQALALVKKLHVTPEDNATSKALTTQAVAKRAELAKLTGASFDKAYIANEVAYHKTVNGALETTLIPSSSNGELKTLLQTGLKLFQGHQQHAEQTAAKVVIAIDAMSFSTTKTPIRAGDTVEWVNRDIVDHTATDKSGLWNVSMAPGQSAKVVMKKAGTFDYYCRYHPNMIARLVVAAPAKK